jgi:protein-tyrosine kinase
VALGKLYNALEKLKKESIPPGGVGDAPFSLTSGIGASGMGKVPEEPVATGYVESKISNSLVTFQRPLSFEAEQFKMLKSMILFPESTTPPRTIMVTSVAPGEGKSFVASNLAVSIAQNIDEHVLLTDCDLRKPDIHKIFGYGEIDGLTEHLSKGKSLSSVLYKTIVDKLTLLPGGRPSHNSTELLASEKMLGLLQEAKSRYRDRYIIIDSPPPYMASEANVLARYVDAVLLVIGKGKTKRESIADMVEMLGRKKFLGVVFNYFDIRSLQRFGYGKYSNYAKYHGVKG